jgi:AhpD family alkylhydroperoxidase
MTNWPQETTDLSTLLRSLRGAAPDVMKAFAGIAKAATVSKALDAKTKELIALGIAVAVRCDDCIAFHAKAAVDHGATRDEVSETLGMAIYMGAPVGHVCQPRARSFHAIRGRRSRTIGREGGRHVLVSRSPISIPHRA